MVLTPSSGTKKPFAVDIVTLVPDVWPAWLAPETGLLGRAFERGLAELRLTPLRSFGRGAHRQVDDAPYGGGAGMVMAVGPLHKAIKVAQQRTRGPTILLGPRGGRLTHQVAQTLASGPGMILVCGRFEGVDERVRSYCDFELSVGDFILTAGDPAALCLVDATVRLLPQVLGNPESLGEESFSAGRLEAPHYTRPQTYEGQTVPSVLLSGDHAQIARWREARAQELTEKLRPDLLLGGTSCGRRAK